MPAARVLSHAERNELINIITRGRHQALERARHEALELVGLAALLRAQRGRDALRAARAVGHIATGVVSAPAKRRAPGARGCLSVGLGAVAPGVGVADGLRGYGFCARAAA